MDDKTLEEQFREVGFLPLRVLKDEPKITVIYVEKGYTVDDVVQITLTTEKAYHKCNKFITSSIGIVSQFYDEMTNPTPLTLDINNKGARLNVKIGEVKKKVERTFMVFENV